MKIRDSRFEVLRIVAIFFILLSHFSMFSPWDKDNLTSVNAVISVTIFTVLGKVGAYLFAMITGYFMSTREISTDISHKQVKNIWMQTFFYSATIAIVISIVNGVNLSSLIKSIFPIVFGTYWFVTAYVFLILLVPFINNAINNKSKKNIIELIVLCTIMSDVLPFLGNEIGGTPASLMSLIAAYLIGSFIKVYGINLTKIRSIYGIIIGFLMMYLSIIVFYLMTVNAYTEKYVSGFFDIHTHGAVRLTYLSTGLLPVATATFIFILVDNIQPFHNNYINKIAKTVFATYLITEQPMFRSILWNNLFNVSRYQNNILITFLLGLVSVICIMIVTCCIELIRQKIFKYFFDRSHKI